jgi:hypothetical protein
MAVGLLKGGALNWYMPKSKTNELPFFPTLDAWLEFVQESFPPSDAQNTTYPDEIKKLRPLISVPRCGVRFYEYLLHIYDMSNDEAMDKLIDGLKKEVRIVVRRDRLKTFEEDYSLTYTHDATLMEDKIRVTYFLLMKQETNAITSTLKDIFNASILLRNPVLSKGAITALVSAAGLTRNSLTKTPASIAASRATLF